MRPDYWKPFAGGATETVLHPAAVAILVIAAVLMWTLPRRHLLKPFLWVAILVPQTQQVVLAGVHFPVLRILICCAWLRVGPRLWGRSRFLAGGLTSTDIVLTMWVAWTAIAYTMAWGDIGAVMPKLGFMFNAVGVYFLIRHLIRDKEDVKKTIKIFSVLCVVLAAMMAIEQLTGRNLLSMFGAPELAEIRQGRIRSQGSFAHSILAGAFGAFLLPVFLSVWWSCRSRRALIGACAAAIMVAASASSTPVGAAAAGLAAILIWPLRKQMRAIRWGALATLVTLHLVMKAPVWSLLHRVRFVGGSTSWDRFMLVDQCIRHFSDWWIIGTANNEAWGLDMWDTQDWYVGCAVTGGLIGLGLFVALISLSFRNAGLARLCSDGTLESRRLAWGLGAGLFASAVAFLGVELFDQSVVGWYALLALIAAMAVPAGPSRKATAAYVAIEPDLESTSAGREMSQSFAIRHYIH
jgi:hypothetical protein